MRGEIISLLRQRTFFHAFGCYLPSIARVWDIYSLSHTSFDDDDTSTRLFNPFPSDRPSRFSGCLSHLGDCWCFSFRLVYTLWDFVRMSLALQFRTNLFLSVQVSSRSNYLLSDPVVGHVHHSHHRQSTCRIHGRGETWISTDCSYCEYCGPFHRYRDDHVCLPSMVSSTGPCVEAGDYFDDPSEERSESNTLENRTLSTGADLSRRSRLFESDRCSSWADLRLSSE